jgi:signal transduction histidine kinase
MTGPPLDYVLGFLLPGALLLGTTSYWLIRRAHLRGRDLVPALLLALLLQPFVWYSVESAAGNAKDRIFAALTAFAPTYAQEMALLGHAQISRDTPDDSPAYLGMIEAQKRWLTVNPAAADIYTFRIREDGSLHFVVDAETDYDRDGDIEGEREERTGIGEPMVTELVDPIRQAMRGSPVVDDVVETDRWGSWVSVYAPIPGPDGKPEALLGIDYHAEAYVSAVSAARRRALAVNGVIGATILALAVIIALLRYNVADREERNARLDAAAREVQQLNSDLERRIQDRTKQLESANRELEAFAYSVSHDLRTPLRTIEGFAKLVTDDPGNRLSAESLENLDRVQRAGRHMAALIDDILRLSRVTRGDLRREPVDFSELARGIGEQLRQRQPLRDVSLTVTPHLVANADARLLEVLLRNLLENAWKYTGGREHAEVEVGRRADGTWFVRDNGCGFDMRFVDKLFRPFQRLHSESEFEGNGIGLATVARVVERHGGTVAAVAAPDAGCTVSFTLGEARPS